MSARGEGVRDKDAKVVPHAHPLNLTRVPHRVAVPEVTQPAPGTKIPNRPRFDELGGVFAPEFDEPVEHSGIVSGVFGCMIAVFVEFQEPRPFFRYEGG